MRRLASFLFGTGVAQYYNRPVHIASGRSGYNQTSYTPLEHMVKCPAHSHPISLWECASIPNRTEPLRGYCGAVNALWDDELKRCRIFTQHPAVFQCMHGYLIGYKDRKLCKNHGRVAPTPTCDPPYRLVDDRCEKRLVGPAELGCLPGEKKEGYKCIRGEHVNMNLICPEGFTPHDDMHRSGLCERKHSQLGWWANNSPKCDSDTLWIEVFYERNKTRLRVPEVVCSEYEYRQGHYECPETKDIPFDVYMRTTDNWPLLNFKDEYGNPSFTCVRLTEYPWRPVCPNFRGRALVRPLLPIKDYYWIERPYGLIWAAGRNFVELFHETVEAIQQGRPRPVRMMPEAVWKPSKKSKFALRPDDGPEDEVSLGKVAADYMEEEGVTDANGPLGGGGMSPMLNPNFSGRSSSGSSGQRRRLLPNSASDAAEPVGLRNPGATLPDSFVYKRARLPDNPFAKPRGQSDYVAEMLPTDESLYDVPWANGTATSTIIDDASVRRALALLNEAMHTQHNGLSNPRDLGPVIRQLLYQEDEVYDMRDDLQSELEHVLDLKILSAQRVRNASDDVLRIPDDLMTKRVPFRLVAPLEATAPRSNATRGSRSRASARVSLDDLTMERPGPIYEVPDPDDYVAAGKYVNDVILKMWSELHYTQIETDVVGVDTWVRWMTAKTIEIEDASRLWIGWIHEGIMMPLCAQYELRLPRQACPPSFKMGVDQTCKPMDYGSPVIECPPEFVFDSWSVLRLPHDIPDKKERSSGADDLVLRNKNIPKCVGFVDAYTEHYCDHEACFPDLDNRVCVCDINVKPALRSPSKQDLVDMWLLDGAALYDASVEYRKNTVGLKDAGLAAPNRDPTTDGRSRHAPAVVENNRNATTAAGQDRNGNATASNQNATGTNPYANSPLPQKWYPFISGLLPMKIFRDTFKEYYTEEVREARFKLPEFRTNPDYGVFRAVFGPKDYIHWIRLKRDFQAEYLVNVVADRLMIISSRSGVAQQLLWNVGEPADQNYGKEAYEFLERRNPSSTIFLGPERRPVSAQEFSAMLQQPEDAPAELRNLAHKAKAAAQREAERALEVFEVLANHSGPKAGELVDPPPPPPPSPPPDDRRHRRKHKSLESHIVELMSQPVDPYFRPSYNRAANSMRVPRLTDGHLAIAGEDYW